ncbi:hypothetical protein [Kitasatospora sp. P5_F3]
MAGTGGPEPVLRYWTRDDADVYKKKLNAISTTVNGLSGSVDFLKVALGGLSVAVTAASFGVTVAKFDYTFWKFDEKGVTYRGKPVHTWSWVDAAKWEKERRDWLNWRATKAEPEIKELNSKLRSLVAEAKRQEAHIGRANAAKARKSDPADIQRIENRVKDHAAKLKATLAEADKVQAKLDRKLKTAKHERLDAKVVKKKDDAKDKAVKDQAKNVEEIRTGLKNLDGDMKRLNETSKKLQSALGG